MKLTAVQNNDEDESNSLCGSSGTPGPSKQATVEDHEQKGTKISPLPEKECCPPLCNMEQVPVKDLMADSEDILIPEESIIQEEIAEEVETSICECQEENHKTEQEFSEESVSPAGTNEETEAVQLADSTESCVMMNDVTDTVSHVEIKVELKSECPQEDMSVVIDQLEDCVSPARSASSTNSVSDTAEKDSESTKELIAPEMQNAALEGSLFTGGGIAVDMELQSDPEEQSSENACISETSFPLEVQKDHVFVLRLLEETLNQLQRNPVLQHLLKQLVHLKCPVLKTLKVIFSKRPLMKTCIHL